MRKLEWRPGAFQAGAGAMRNLSRAVSAAAALLLAPFAASADTPPASPPPAAPPPLTVPADLTMTSLSGGAIIGRLFRPKSAIGALPGVVLLGGSEGGLNSIVSLEAELLARQGYVVLQLGYFGAPGLPEKLQLIPIEYFTHAVDWLGAQPGVDDAHIGIFGASIGGEVALVVAAYDPKIKAVVAAVPSSVVWPGIDTSSTPGERPSTFTLAGKPLPDLPYGWTGAFHGVFALYDDGLKALDQHPDAVIPVEKINGRVMLVCGQADTLWPSCPMSEQAAARLKAHGRPVELLEYAEAGHTVFGPPVDPAVPYFRSIAPLGGTPEGVATARKDAWPKALAFLAAALKPAR
jgi:uncharacterized protein